MVRYSGLILVFILLVGLMFSIIPQGYPQDSPNPPDQNQDQPPDHEPAQPPNQPLDQKKIDEAIDKGVAFLLKKGIKGRETELIILTLLHASVNPKKNRTLRTTIAKLKTSQLALTYNVALTAMALEMADPHKYQYRIAECAQALVNYQCMNGQWSYTSKYNISQGRPKKTRETAGLREGVVTGKNYSKSTKPLKKIIVKRRNKNRPKKGDNSNTQYGLFGLRAAARCGVEIPQETWKDAVEYLTSAQLPDGGWDYIESGRKQGREMRSYGSMTCAGVCGLAIAKFYLNQDQNLFEDSSIKKGLGWLANNFTFEKNPGPITVGNPKDDKCMLYYYIYGIERVGAILGIQKIGSHNWYQEGAKYLLAEQQANGAWHYPGDDRWLIDVTDTCFAILFLKRATQPLLKPVITGDE